MSEKLTVKNVVNINKSTLSAKDNWSTLKYLDTGNITENQIDTLQIFQKGEKLPSRAKRKVEKGTIIYSTVRPNQKHFGYFDTHSNDLVVSTGFATLDVIDPRINSKYLYYLLTQNSVISQLQSIGENSTSSYPSIRPEDIGNLSFVFPDIDIQNKIADILTSIDKKIQINNQINQELEAMAKTLYDYWFVQFDFLDQNGKPYKSSGGKMVYHPELKREIPEGWGNSTLGEFADLYQPKTISDKEMIDDGEYLVYGANGIIGRYSEYNHEDSMVTISCRGNCGIINVTRPYSWITGNSMVVKPKDDIYNIDYISNLLLSLSISSVITGSVQKQLTRTSLVPLKIIIPNKEIIEKYRAITNVSFEKRKAIQIEVEQLTQLRDWLLPMLMNGRVKVK